MINKLTINGVDIETAFTGSLAPPDTPKGYMSPSMCTQWIRLKNGEWKERRSNLKGTLELLQTLTSESIIEYINNLK